MDCKPLICGEPIIEVERKQYEKLIAKEEKLRLLEKGLSSCKGSYMTDYEMVKELFGLKKGVDNE